MKEMIFCRLKLRVLVLTTVFILKSFVVTEALHALKGSTVQIRCMHLAESDQRLSWRKGSMFLSENLLIANSSMKERLNITGDHSLGEYHLNISDIRKNDEGAYTCSFSGTNKVDTHQLIVIVGPTSVAIENKAPDNKITGIEGHAMIIKCTAVGGDPLPYIKLVILGIDYNGSGSAQHTLTPTSSDDGSTVKCQAGYKEIDYYPLSDTAVIHLKLKPVITSFAPETLNTEESKSFDVQCESVSRPVAAMNWLLGQQKINVTTNSSTQSNHDTITDKFTVTSNLKYSVDRRYNKKKLICRAVNIAGYVERSLTLNVKYAPGVTVENKTFTQTQSARLIHSTVDSNPPVNTCFWLQRSKYGDHIRYFNDNHQILTLPTVLEDQRYQDTGEYICTAENGIIGINGQEKQTGSGYVISNAPPVITSDNKDSYTQYGKFKQSTELKVNVYSIPKFSSKRWYRGETYLSSNKYEAMEEAAIVKDVFHGAEVHLDGYRVTLTIHDLQEADFTNYTLRLYNGNQNQIREHMVILESASAPETPLNFTITGSGETSITFQWIPGYNGGQTQTFFVEYRIGGTTAWMSHEIKTGSYSFYTLSRLQDQTSYELRMYAKNKFNQSQHTDIETKTTLRKEEITGSGGVIGGVAGGLVAVITILAVIAFVLFKRKKDSGFSSKRRRSRLDSEVEEGLKDNILYDGSEPEGLRVNVLDQSAGPDSINQVPTAEYAEISKPSKKPQKSTNDEYAEVQKQNDVYAEVDKKAQKKNVKRKKQKALNNNPDGEYANSDIPMGNISDGEYTNAEDRSAGNKKNEQGLEYADLTFGNQTAKGRQPVIHGDENRTIYSEVDHTKKAPPPPQESEYEETDIRHGKKK